MEKDFLKKIIEKKLPVSVFLTCNVKLQGVILQNNDNSLILEHEGRLQLIYKHAISTISVGNLIDGADFVS